MSRMNEEDREFVCDVLDEAISGLQQGEEEAAKLAEFIGRFHFSPGQRDMAEALFFAISNVSREHKDLLERLSDKLGCHE